MSNLQQPNVALPVTNLGPDPRDVKTSKSRTTSLPGHPKHFIKGQMNLVEKVADISKAEEEGEPLIPVFTSSLEADIKGHMYRHPDSEILVTAGNSHTGITSTVESHPAPMVSSRASDFKFKFPEIPDQARKVKDDFYFPLGEYLQVTHDLLKKWKVSVIPPEHAPSPSETKLCTASQVVTTCTQTLHSTGFWEATEPIPSMEEGATVKPTTTTSAPTLTQIPMEIDDDVIFVDDRPKCLILGRKSKKQAKLASSSVIPICRAPVSTVLSSTIPIYRPPLGTPLSSTIPICTAPVISALSGAIPVAQTTLTSATPSAIPIIRTSVSVVPPRTLIQTRLNYGRPVFPAPTLVTGSHQ